MRLISCYIENFGGLSGFRLDFSEGITVVREDNGFGKTTLAEFIRAMFYGFPRAGKTLEKNPRKRYEPWNGGRFGGYLIFSHGGKHYRIDRTFGSTPRGDTFELTDAVTHRRSSDYTSNIGQELFELDAESFARTTYMPQNHDNGTLATNSIQSKLGDLVHDTGDINNYDKAVKALREKRSSLIPYKGRGGAVAEAGEKITALYGDIDRAEALCPQQEALQEELEQLRREEAVKSGALERIRQAAELCAQYAARESAVRQLETAREELRRQQAQLDRLEQAYPGGIPTMNEVKRIEAILEQLPALQPLPDSAADREAAQTAAQSRFAAGVPGEADFVQLRRDAAMLIRTRSELQGVPLCPEDQARLVQLEQLFARGVPSEADLERGRSLAGECAGLRERELALRSEGAEQDRLRELRDFFRGDIPDPEELEAQQELLDRAEALRRENLERSAVLETAVRSVPQPQKGRAGLLAMILGGVLAGIGIVLLILEQITPGVIALAGGTAVFAVGFALKLKQDMTSQFQSAAQPLPTMSVGDRERLRENTEQIAAMEDRVRSFAERWFDRGCVPGEAVMQLRLRREELLALEERHQEILCRQEALQQRHRMLSGELASILGNWLTPEGDPAEQILALQGSRTEYLDLTRKQADCLAREQSLRMTCEKLQRQLHDALEPYFSGPLPEDLTEAIAELERESGRYTAALAHLERRDEQRRERKEKLDRLRGELASVAERYGIDGDLEDRERFYGLRDDIQELPRLRTQIAQSRESLRQLQQEHAGLLELPQRQDLQDPDSLKSAQALLDRQLRQIREKIVTLQHNHRSLTGQIDRIPQLRDELERWKERKQSHADTSATLDRTLEFLEQAKESLSAKYMGTVQQRFISYMNRISGEDRERIFVSPELEVHMERLGQRRPLASFSAGETDLVELCMRLALVDALFGENTPFVILDDPFVNLDDGNMRRALAVLKELARDHQIIYLVCSSSRI